ncbi:MAG: glycosyltransferase [Xanthobacteraceae bacterium]
MAQGKKFEIAVVVPMGYGGGSIRGAINTAVQIFDGARSYGDDVRVRFGFVDIGQAESHRATFRQLVERRIVPEPIRVDALKSRDLSQRAGEDGPFAVFNNGTDNFDTAGFVLIVPDRVPVRVAPTYRYGILAYDFIQRYVPAIIDDPQSEPRSRRNWSEASSYLRNYSFAEAVFTTTQQTRRDAISFAGVPPRKVCLLPSEFDPLESDASPAAPRSETPYLIWTTNASIHKNHLRALDALELAMLADPEFPHVYVTGALTERLKGGSGSPYADRVADRFKSSERLRRLVKIVGHLSDDQYLALLSKARLLFHPALFDNGTFAVLEAAWHGVPSVSSDYPAMREIAQRFGIPLAFFDAHDPDGMARALLAANRDHARLAQQIPGRDHLRQFSPRQNAPKFWSAMRPFVLGERGSQAPVH